MSYQFESMAAQKVNFPTAAPILVNGALDNAIGQRNYQEDCAAIVPVGQSNQDRLVVIADGAGGHNAGDQAALIVVRSFIEAAYQGCFDGNEDQRPRILLECLYEANRKIGEFAQQHAIAGDIGTTAVAAVFSNTQVHWISVGDSHLYVQNRDGLIKLNADHSYAAHLVETGKLSPRSPEFSKYSHILYSALTGQEPRLIDLPSTGYRPKPGDKFLLMTDGIDTLGPTGIQNILSRGEALPPAQLCRQLIDGVMGQNFPQQDNTTVAVIRIDALNHNFSGSAQDGAVAATEDTTGRMSKSGLKASALVILIFLGLLAVGWFILFPPDISIAEPGPTAGASSSTAKVQSLRFVKASKAPSKACRSWIQDGQKKSSCTYR